MGLSNTQKGILFAFLGYNCFTLGDTCSKLLTESYSVSAISFWTYFVALLMSLIFALPKGIKKSLGTHKLFLHLVRSVFMLIASLLSIAALNGLSLPTLYTIVFLSPAVTALLASFVYKEHLSKLGWSVIFIGFAGIVAAYIKDASFASPAIIYAFGVVLFGASINLMARPIDGHESMLTFPFYPSLVIVFGLLGYFLIYKGESLPIPAMTDIPIFVVGGFSVFMAQMFVLQGYRIAAHDYVAPMQYTQMISGIIAGYYVFSEFPGPWVLIGAGMIIASGLLLIMQKK